jgi:hypothetical protein
VPLSGDSAVWVRSLCRVAQHWAAVAAGHVHVGDRRRCATKHEHGETSQRHGQPSDKDRADYEQGATECRTKGIGLRPDRCSHYAIDFAGTARQRHGGEPWLWSREVPRVLPGPADSPA